MWKELDWGKKKKTSLYDPSRALDVFSNQYLPFSSYFHIFFFLPNRGTYFFLILFFAVIRAKGYVNIFYLRLPYPLALLYLLLPWPNWVFIWKYAKIQQNGMGRSHMLEM